MTVLTAFSELGIPEACGAAEEVLILEGISQQKTDRGLLGEHSTPRRLFPTAKPALFREAI